MARYTQDSLERVKEAIDMVDLVGARTDLRRVGGRYTGLCPFHEERTPSFSVNAEHKLYHCFGCGESGDAIGFVQATEALDFRGAIELLAERYGVELKTEREDPAVEERRRRRERLLQLLERATAYYARYLWESSEAAAARAYLAERGLGEKVLHDFRVGYAPTAWDRVVGPAERDGFSREEIATAGLGQEGRGGRFHDRFRARIMFPLADPRGRVLGFGARAAHEGQRPKYLNSSESEIYHKGRQLFGIDRARGPAARAGRLVVVEGYTDVLALHQAGIPECVAVMGTALTPDQLAEMSRAAGTIYLALDADRSGQEAMLRASQGAAERGVELRVVSLPEGADPAELVGSEGTEGFRSRLEAALSVPEFQARRVLAGADLRTPAGRDRALAELRPLVAATPERSATRDALVRHVADQLDLPADYVVPHAGQARPSRPGAGQHRPSAAATRPAASPHAAAANSRGPAANHPDATPSDPVVRAERAFLAMCLSEPTAGPEYLGRLTDAHLSERSLLRVRDWLAEHFDDPLAGLPADDPGFTALVTSVAMHAEEEPSSEAVVRLSFLQLELRRIERELRRAARERDFEAQRGLWASREDVRLQMGELMGQTA